MINDIQINFLENVKTTLQDELRSTDISQSHSGIELLSIIDKVLKTKSYDPHERLILNALREKLKDEL